MVNLKALFYNLKRAPHSMPHFNNFISTIMTQGVSKTQKYSLKKFMAV